MERKWIAIYILFLISVLLLVPACRAEDTGELFALGNGAYEEGDYDEAISKYEQALSSEEVSGPLYYNLGNAYFKSGNTGKAILNYMRAKLYIPRDADLNANLRFARSEIKRKVLIKAGIWGWTPLHFLSENFTVNELTIMASGVFLISLVLIMVGVYGPFAKSRVMALVVLCVVFIVISALVVQHKADLNSKEAVILKPDVEAKFGPFDSAVKFFVLQEGMVVMQQGVKGEWSKIRRTDGKVGWVEKDALEKVISD